MQNSEPLVFLGIAIIVTAVVVILLPYLRRRSDLLTSWNILWFGGALFTGIGSLAVVYGNFHWVELQWFQPTRSNIQKYIIGSIAFYGSLLFLYYVASWPKSLSARVFNNWPPLTFPLLVVALSLFAAIAIVAHLTQGVVFFGPLFLNITHKGLVFSVVLAFCYWYRDRKQHLFLALFLIVYLFAALDSMVLFRGRRLLLSVAVAPLICLYWQR